MIPQSFKEILANNEYAGILQTIAMIIFIIFFILLIVYVFSRPKKYYKEEAELPLEDDSESLN